MARYERKLVDRLRPLFEAIRFVETGGHPNPENAFGDNDTSFGPYQIGDPYWQDARMPHGEWHDVEGDEYAEEVMIRYWKRYAHEALISERWEVLARMHNGGPRGHEKDATIIYWERVKFALCEQVTKIVRKL